MTEQSRTSALVSANPANPSGLAGSLVGEAAAVGSADAHLRQFCESSLELLQAGAAHGSVLAHVLPSLVRILAECGPGAVAQLREEMRTWEAASEQLTQLACIHCGDEAAGLLTRLEHARGHAGRVIDALAGIQAVLPPLPAGAPKISHGQKSAPLAQPDVAGRGDRGPDDRAAAEPRLSDREQAGSLFRYGQKLHQAQEFDAAETAYGDALQLDGELRLAYLHRGRIRLMRGRLEAAIEDFSQTLRLDPSDPLAYGWRGDASTLLGRHETAIDDYTRALKLRPDLALVRYNRAVALRQAGRWDAALAEFDVLATLRPAHAPIFLNRGLICQTQGRFEEAAQEFRTALRHQPDSREAQQHLQEIEPLLPPAPATPASETPSPATASLSIHDIDEAPELPQLAPTPTALLTSVAPASHASSASIAAPASAAGAAPVGAPVGNEVAGHAVNSADRFNLNFVCPACGSTAIMRLDRMQLGKVLGCPSCRRKFTSKESGSLVEVLKDAHGRWKEKPPRVQYVDARQLLLGAGSILLMLAIYWGKSLLPSAIAAHDADMPAELQPRAELFAWAWLKGDFRTMKILTDDKQGELLFNWCLENPAPQVRSQHTLEKDVKLYVQVPPGEDNPTVLNVRIDGLRSRSGKASELSLAWEQQRRGVWKFLPAPPTPL